MSIHHPDLITENLLLRPILATDLKHVYKGLSHPDVIQYYGVRYDTIEETQTQMEWYKNLVKEETGVWWAICSQEGGDFLGACGFNNLLKLHRKAEIGFWLLPEYWGHGITVSSVKLICKYAFEKMDLHRIEAVVEAGNDNCKKLMAKAGFELEGTMRDAEVKNDRYISLHLYALLKM